jgi:hypothetical protein
MPDPTNPPRQRGKRSKKAPQKPASAFSALGMTSDPQNQQNAPATSYEANSAFDPFGNPVLDGLSSVKTDKRNVAPATTNQTPNPADLSDTELARLALRAVLLDPGAPGAAKASAARTLLEMAGTLGKNAKPVTDTSKPVGELSREELERELRALSG